MTNHLLTVFQYFAYFSYAPSFEEIYTFFPRKIRKKDLHAVLKLGITRKQILRLPKNAHSRGYQGFFKHKISTSTNERYTLPQYSISLSKKLHGVRSIPNKWTVKAIQTYISLLKRIPLVRFVGATGTGAMEGLKNNDDFDLCIVAKHKMLWTTRFIIIMVAKCMGLHHSNGVCINLFFDESNLSIPRRKQNLYIAHEILQMKPIIDTDTIYPRFLAENRWLYRYFPNAQRFVQDNDSHPSRKTQTLRDIMRRTIDYLFKSIQIPIIMRNNTALSISSTQLWLFKNDFEKKLKREGLVK
jgi:hypothetical protein